MHRPRLPHLFFCWLQRAIFAIVWCLIPALVEARAGGGGSGGGGGGGGSGGGGRGGGNTQIAFLLFAIILFQRLYKRKYGALLILAAIIFIVSFSGIFLYTRHDGSCGSVLFETLFGLLFFLILEHVGGQGRWMNKNKETVAQLVLWKKNHPEWEEKTLIHEATLIFKRFQDDWSCNDTRFFPLYLSARYTPHATLMVQALCELNRSNVISNYAITSIKIIQAQENNGVCEYKVAIKARARDQLFEGNELIFTDRTSFTEVWCFVFENNSWKLDRIEQMTLNQNRLHKKMADFAVDNMLYYSPDWGYLLLPRRGGLFGMAAFGYSDINNHCLGLYRGVLVQMYTYFPFGLKNGNEYVIAQVTVPRSYGTIYVRPKSWWRPKPRGLKRVVLEWGEFNKRFQVYASDLERATSLELLHPAYMERLAAVGFPMSIQVNDRTIYIAAQIDAAKTITAYQTMLTLVHEAFKELKM